MAEHITPSGTGVCQVPMCLQGTCRLTRGCTDPEYNLPNDAEENERLGKPPQFPTAYRSALTG
jgi:hypothetical protein